MTKILRRLRRLIFGYVDKIAPDPLTPTEWEIDCLKWRGRVLTGEHAHWCPDWDDLPIDETTPEWPCVCCNYGACEKKPAPYLSAFDDNDSV
jgi:hypothetical protein